MKALFFKIGLRFAVFQLSLLLCQTALASVAFTITPTAVSNTYNGTITLLVTGLTSGDTVVVQKFLDANSNGIIDAGDLLFEQFKMTDGQAGMVIGGVTNFNVPGDTDKTATQITAKLIFQGDFTQTIVGQYLFKLSSPANHFTAITKSFAVTNFPYAQKFTGTVLSNGVAIPGSPVILFQPKAANNDLNPVGGAVANNSGVYTIQAPAGTYLLAAVKSNFIADTTVAANLVLSNGATFNTNLSLIPATESISGSFVDATNAATGVPGLLVPVQTKSRLLGIAFSDTNGNFSAGVTTNDWGVNTDSGSIARTGYLALQDSVGVDATAGSVSNLTIALSKGSALFYGTVLDNFGQPVPGNLAVEAYDDGNDSMYQSDGYADANGNYVTAAVGGLGSDDTWQVNVDNQSLFPNYNFSQPAFDDDGGFNLGLGQAVMVNIVAQAIVSGPGLGSPEKLSSGKFQFTFNGVANQNYTVQESTNLSFSNWNPLFVTNSTTAKTFIVVDPNASTQQRFYRVLVGP